MTIPYTEEELEFISRQMKEQNKKAAEVAKKRGYKKNPRIEEAKLK